VQDTVVRRIEGFRLHDQNVVVKVTDAHGRSGWGGAVATLGGAAGDMLRHVAPHVIGENPFDTGKVSRAIFRHGYRIGGSGAYMAAASAIDIALYDLQGQLLQTPVWSLLGGRFRSEVPVYSSLMRVGRSAADQAVLVRQRVDEGFRAVKLHTAQMWGEGTDDDTLPVVGAVRAAVGDDIGIMVDVNQAYSVPAAVAMGERLVALGVDHFEEPIVPWDLDGYAHLRDRLPMQIAAGEQCHNLWQFRDLIERGKVQVIQPNVTACGGFTVATMVAALAEAHNRQVVCHSTEPTLGTAASAQFWAATGCCELPQEYLGEPSHPLRDVTPILRSGPRVEAGVLHVPDEPGLGVVVDEDVVRDAATHSWLFGES
jgi:L-alanine-DL-glutamate epimerase-like enolase superfamily enzyme